MHTVKSVIWLIAAFISVYFNNACAHFQELIPGRDIVEDPTQAMIRLDMRFTHPMSGGPVMEMGSPTAFGVQVNGNKVDLLERLTPEHNQGKRTFTADYRLQQPGDHLFYLEPTPYWEPAEGRMVLHYTKVVVDAFGAETGWDQQVGFPVEIEPLVRPYGLWTGNSFRGVVRHNGRPAAHVVVEVEWRNDGSVKVPAAPFTTQVLKTDAQGIFSYTAPRAGWWGFAALINGEARVNNPEGRPVPLEQGGLIWVRFVDMPSTLSR